MRKLVRLAAWLYPAPWRKRYASEFAALLDDVRPGARDVWDVVREALIMQTTSWNFGKIAGLCALAGVVVAGVVAYMQPTEYVSTAVMRIAPSAVPEGTSPGEVRLRMLQWLQQMQTEILSRSSLAKIITSPALDLYKDGRAREPLEDIVMGMRNKSIRIQPVNPMGTSASSTQAFAISYTYPDKFKSQAVVRELVSKFVEVNVAQQRSRQKADGIMENLEVLDPASLPNKPNSPNWPRMLIAGLIGGLLVGVIAAFVATNSVARTLKIVGSGIAGFVVTAALSFLIPNQYVSTAVLRAGPGVLGMEQLVNDDLLGRVVAAQSTPTGMRVVQSVEELRRGLTIRGETVPPDTANVPAYVIAFKSKNRFGAQWVVRQIIAEAIDKLVTPLVTPNPALEVLDPASDPTNPASPNRLAMASTGMLAGLIVGAWLLRSKRTVAPV